MKLFFIGERANVIERWQALLTDWQPQIVKAAELNAEQAINSIFLIHLSSMSSADIKLIFSFKRDNPHSILIVCTDMPNQKEGIDVIQSGANGYTNTYVTGSLLSEVVKTVLRGDIWAGPELLQALVKRLLNKSGSGSDSKVDTTKSVNSFGQLSSREKEVLSVLVTGLSNKEIARELDITERTVKAHVSSILHKTGASDRIALVLMVNKEPMAEQELASVR